MPSPKLGCTCWTVKNREARVPSAWLKKDRHAGPTLRTSPACTAGLNSKHIEGHPVGKSMDTLFPFLVFGIVKQGPRISAAF